MTKKTKKKFPHPATFQMILQVTDDLGENREEITITLTKTQILIGLGHVSYAAEEAFTELSAKGIIRDWIENPDILRLEKLG